MVYMCSAYLSQSPKQRYADTTKTPRVDIPINKVAEKLHSSQIPSHAILDLDVEGFSDQT